MHKPEADEDDKEAAIVDAFAVTAVCCWSCCLGCGAGAGDDSCAEKSSTDADADVDGDCAAENETSM